MENIHNFVIYINAIHIYTCVNFMCSQMGMDDGCDSSIMKQAHIIS